MVEGPEGEGVGEGVGGGKGGKEGEKRGKDCVRGSFGRHLRPLGAQGRPMAGIDFDGLLK